MEKLLKDGSADAAKWESVLEAKRREFEERLQVLEEEKCELKQKLEEKEGLKRTVEELVREVEAGRKSLEALEAKAQERSEALEGEIEVLKQESQRLTTELDETKSQLRVETEKKEEVEKEILDLRKSCASESDAQVGDAQRTLKEREAELESIRGDLRNVHAEVDRWRKENAELRMEKAEVEKDAHEAKAEVTRVERKLALTEGKLEEQIRNSEAQLSKLCDEIAQKDALLSELGAKVETTQEKKEELLGELSSMNSVLKQRGSRIAQLEADLARVTQENAQQLRQPGASSNANQNEVVELRKKVEELQGKLRSKSATPAPEALGVPEETGSTSTISKQEETARLKDLDSSFEEQYQKLKVIAIKQKKKLAEQRTEIETLDGKLTNALTQADALSKKLEETV
ncbi:unnamed protein product, partial [Cyprideis torosa]